ASRGALPLRIGIKHDRDHHRGVVRRMTPSVLAIARVERREVDVPDRVDHEPRQMVLRQPLAQRGRHQQQLLTVTLDEVLSHAQKCLNLTTADRPGVCETASAQSGRSFSLLLSHQSDAPLLEVVTHAIGRDNAIISAAYLMSVFAGAVAQTGRGSGAAASGPPLASRARSSAAGPGRGP